MKVNVAKRGGWAEVYNVTRLPTLVLLDPSANRTLFKEAGAPTGAQFALSLAYPQYKAMIEAFNAQEYAEAAKHTFYLRKWFKGTKPGRAADEVFEQLKGDQGFNSAYETAARESAQRLAKIRRAVLEKDARLRRAAERRRQVEALKEEADRVYASWGKKHRSYKIYKRIIWEHPDSPEADNARMVLRGHKQRWKEPSKAEIDKRKAAEEEALQKEISAAAPSK